METLSGMRSHWEKPPTPPKHHCLCMLEASILDQLTDAAPWWHITVSTLCEPLGVREETGNAGRPLDLK